eukprot:GHRR01009936.1.p1 GENE.GHRR01009936.1~~GHRR01009936.1.p1  ORF type:complete len:399 (+),score=110.56 GHRR01009936.1:81-1277(+)
MFAFAGPNSSTCLHCTSKLSSRRSVHVGCALSNVTVGLHPLQSALAGAPALPAISQMYAADAHNAIPAAARTSVAPGDNGPILGTDRSRSTSTSTSGSSSSWQEVILQKAMEPSQLIRLILKAKIKGDQHVANVSNTASGTPTSSNAVNAATAAAAASQAGVMPYKQLTMRPVLIKNQQQLQISLLDARQDTTKNYTHQQAAEQLQQLLQLPWQSATVHTLQQTVTVQITKKGRALMQQTAATAVPAQQAASAAGLSRQDLQLVQPDDAAIGLIQLQHDRMKALPISGSVADPFLQKIGVQTADGRIKANMQVSICLPKGSTSALNRWPLHLPGQSYHAFHYACLFVAFTRSSCGSLLVPIQHTQHTQPCNNCFCCIQLLGIGWHHLVIRVWSADSQG